MNMNSPDNSSQALKSLSAQLGCQFSNVEEQEAARLWDTLNHLADDPGAYADFMAKQLQHLDSNKDGEVLLNQKSASSAVPPFVPLQGFVVKTFTHPDGTKLFINICHHGTAIQKPIDNDGNLVTVSHQSVGTLRIPLLISKLRDCFDGSNKKSMAVDVVVNSWCIDMCDRTPTFKTELVALAINSLKEEHSNKIRTDRQLPWKIVNSKYKGGLGNGMKPRPFEDSQEPKSTKQNQVTKSPSDLLKCREEQNEEPLSKEVDLKMPQIKIAKKAPNKLIQEISPQQMDAASTASKRKPQSGPSKKSSVMKPGFLNQRSSKKPLYSKNGSTGDGVSGRGGLMSKCKVIDTATTVPVASSRQRNENDQGGALFDPEVHDLTQTLKDLSNVMEAGGRCILD
mmetsp:Transcript_38948/g.81481  ORF Transcript_38948/g.81481 Transcript_38948/m.81481 type:complete len:397 (+) Transcript_38948:105-1295(+)